jgi:hypothetical protein
MKILENNLRTSSNNCRKASASGGGRSDFLYSEALQIDLPWLGEVRKCRSHLPSGFPPQKL